MAVDIFLKLGDIQGESQASQNKGEIDVLAWSWGASNSGTLQVKSGKSAPSFHDLSITKWIDKSSEDLLKLVATGAQVPDAQLTVRKAGTNPINYLIIKFKPVMVTSVSTGGSGGEDRLTENITLNFGKFEFAYTTQNANGDTAGVERFAWDILAGSQITANF